MLNRDARWAALPLIAIVAVIGFSASALRTHAAQSDPWRIVVTVTSEDRNEPVEGASVSVNYTYDPASSPVRLDTMTTDESGRVWIVPGIFGGFLKVEPQPGCKFDITINHPDYVETYRAVPIRRDSRAGDIPVRVSLRRKAGAKLVVVDVFAAGDRAPLYNAQVKLLGTVSPTMFSGTTNAAGRTLISVTEADDYKVKITHNGYEPISASVKVKMYDEQKEYNLSFEMKPTREAERSLRVFVKGKDKDGKTVPVRYAQVTLPDGQTKTTDYEGAAEFMHRLAPGEEARVEAEATYYLPGSATFMVGVRGLSGDAVTIHLEREAAASLTGTWGYAGGRGTAKVTQSGDTVTMNLALSDRTKAGQSEPHYVISARISGSSLTGTWTFHVDPQGSKDRYPFDERFIKAGKNCKGGAFHATFSENTIQVSSDGTEDECGHGWAGLTFSRK